MIRPPTRACPPCQASGNDRRCDALPCCRSSDPYRHAAGWPGPSNANPPHRYPAASPPLLACLDQIFLGFDFFVVAGRAAVGISGPFELVASASADDDGCSDNGGKHGQFHISLLE